MTCRSQGQRHATPSSLHIPVLLASFTIWAILGNEMAPPFCGSPRQAENFPVSIRRHCVACCLLFSAFLPLCLEGAEKFRDAPFGGSLLFGCHVERLGPDPPTMCTRPEGELRNMTYDVASSGEIFPDLLDVEESNMRWALNETSRLVTILNLEVGGRGPLLMESGLTRRPKREACQQAAFAGFLALCA
jgi:hypothetical protein